MTTSYALTRSDFLLTDGWSHSAGLQAARSGYLHDFDFDLPLQDEELHIRALAASGDYFTTLATTLEEIADALPEAAVGQARLQYLASQLQYLQRHYQIVKR